MSSPFPLRKLGSGIWDSLILLLGLLLYSLTLSPGLLPADSGEYQVVGATLGVAHPPGFALYTLLAWLISRWPLAAPAASINWLSALLAALTLVLVSRAARRLTGSAAAGLAAALALGLATTFWAQAVTANVRMLTACAAALALERALAYREARTSAHLGWLALALGLGVSHHGSLIFYLALLGLYALWLEPPACPWSACPPGRPTPEAKRRGSEWGDARGDTEGVSRSGGRALRRPWPLLWGLLPFLAWLYFPLRAGAFGAPPRIATPAGFLEHILARGFSGDMLYFANPVDLPERLHLLVDILPFQFVLPLLLLAGLGALEAVRRDRSSGLLLLALFGLHTFIAITYKAPQTTEYLLPSYMILAVWAGQALAGLAALAARLPGRRGWAAAVWALAALSLAGQFARTYPSYRWLSQDTSTRDYATGLLNAAPPGARLLAAWHWATPLWYLQQVEGQRPDVQVVYVYPRTASLAQDWVDEITAGLARGPVVVTSFYPQEYGALPYRFLPLGPAWEVREEPLWEAPQGLAGAQDFGAWRLHGFRLDSPATLPADAAPLQVLAAWSTTDAPQDINFFVHLVGPDGLLYGQADISRAATRYETDEVLLDRYRLAVRPDAPPGTYRLMAGLYRPDGMRLALTELQAVELTPARFPLPAAGIFPRRFGEAALLGHAVDHSLTDAPRLYLNWQLGSRPAEVEVIGLPLTLPAGPGYLVTTHDLTPGLPVDVGGSRLPDPDPAARHVPLGRGLYLAGVRIAPGRALRPGNQVRVELQFLAARPQVDDIAVGLALVGTGWRAQSDGTPAGGALPTLKWIAGSRVPDRRVLLIPLQAAPGPAQLMLTLYDAFTQEKLALLDPRLAAMGPSVPLGTVEISAP